LSRDATDARLIALETKVSYQEKMIAELNEVIIDQNRTIADLQRRLTLVEGQLQGESGREMPAERPPHY
jgi:SlyX protein